MPIKMYTERLSLGHAEFGVSVRPPGKGAQQAENGCESEDERGL